MKSLFLIAALSVLGTQALAQTAVMSCKNISVVEGVDAAGKPVMGAGQASVEILETSPGKYTATISSAGTISNENDVAVTLENPATVADLKNMIAGIAPDIDASQVKQVQLGNVGVKANTQDGGGIILMNLLDVNNKSLGMLVRMGWGFGRCN